MPKKYASERVDPIGGLIPKTITNEPLSLSVRVDDDAVKIHGDYYTAYLLERPVRGTLVVHDSVLGDLTIDNTAVPVGNSVCSVDWKRGIVFFDSAIAWNTVTATYQGTGAIVDWGRIKIQDVSDGTGSVLAEAGKFMKVAAGGTLFEVDDIYESDLVALYAMTFSKVGYAMKEYGDVLTQIDLAWTTNRTGIVGTTLDILHTDPAGTPTSLTQSPIVTTALSSFTGQNFEWDTAGNVNVGALPHKYSYRTISLDYTGDDGTTGVLNVNYEWAWKHFVGCSNLALAVFEGYVDPADIAAALGAGTLRKAIAGTHPFVPANQYLYFIIPASFTITKFSVGGLEVVFNESVTTNPVVNALGESCVYKIYQSPALLTGAVSVLVEE